MTETFKRQLEQRASAHLDGELDAGQSAELYRDLLREPQARAMLEDWSAADLTAAQALRRAVDAPSSRAVSVDRLTRRKRSRIPWLQLLITTLLLLALAVLLPILRDLTHST